VLNLLVHVCFYYIRHEIYDLCLSTLFTMPTMPSIHDTETLLVQHYKGLTQHLKTAWIKVHEEKCALTERNAELLSEVAEAASSIVDRDRTIQERDTTVEEYDGMITQLDKSSKKLREDKYFLSEDKRVLSEDKRVLSEDKRVLSEDKRALIEDWIEDKRVLSEDKRALTKRNAELQTKLDEAAASIVIRDRTLQGLYTTVEEYVDMIHAQQFMLAEVVDSKGENTTLQALLVKKKALIARRGFLPEVAEAAARVPQP